MLRLPNSEQAWVPQEKVTDYLLLPEHEQGGNKAEFFLKSGFTIERWEDFADTLLVHGTTCEVARVVEDQYGTRYAVEGEIETPVGCSVYVRSVWQIDRGSEYPRLITAYHIGRG